MNSSVSAVLAGVVGAVASVATYKDDTWVLLGSKMGVLVGPKRRLATNEENWGARESVGASASARQRCVLRRRGRGGGEKRETSGRWRGMALAGVARDRPMHLAGP